MIQSFNISIQLTGLDLTAVKSFVYQRDGISRNDTFSKLSLTSADQSFESVDDISFCVSIKLFIYKPSIAYIIESGPEEQGQGETGGLGGFKALSFTLVTC